MTKRYAAKVDTNQKEIVKALRAIGAIVHLLHRVGEGCPDLLVGYRGVNYLIEVKNLDGLGDKKTPAQIEWHDNWRGQVDTVTSISEALELVLNKP